MELTTFTVLLLKIYLVSFIFGEICEEEINQNLKNQNYSSFEQSDEIVLIDFYNAKQLEVDTGEHNRREWGECVAGNSGHLVVS